jgi:hypothetical protein
MRSNLTSPTAPRSLFCMWKLPRSRHIDSTCEEHRQEITSHATRRKNYVAGGLGPRTARPRRIDVPKVRELRRNGACGAGDGGCAVLHGADEYEQIGPDTRVAGGATVGQRVIDQNASSTPVTLTKT